MKKHLVSIALIMLLSTPLALAAAEADSDAGKVLFEARCGLCHQLPEPSMLKLPQWQRLLQTMQLRMQQSGMAPLTQQELQQLLAYLAMQARQ
jgi:mono/diheme cytochrome c family protein